ncbi:hypothetical protein YN1HA_25870 [Sulfurisphaera ohwakuensis]
MKQVKKFNGQEDLLAKISCNFYPKIFIVYEYFSLIAF